MPQSFEQIPAETSSQERVRSRHGDLPRNEEDWYSRSGPSVLLSDEAFEKFERALEEPRPPSDRLKALFARRRKL